MNKKTIILVVIGALVLWLWYKNRKKTVDTSTDAENELNNMLADNSPESSESSTASESTSSTSSTSSGTSSTTKKYSSAYNDMIQADKNDYEKLISAVNLALLKAPNFILIGLKLIADSNDNTLAYQIYMSSAENMFKDPASTDYNEDTYYRMLTVEESEVHTDLKAITGTDYKAYQ